jgi:hypothetical protein
MATMGSMAIAVTKPENKFPDCLKLEISGEIVDKSLLASLKNPEPEKINLFVRINFHEQWIDFPSESMKFGRAKFGLRGGELRLKLENGKMPSESISEALKKFPESELSGERQVVREDENKSQFEGSFNLGLFKIGFKVGREHRQKDSISDKFPIKIAQISHKGEDDQPVWVFENQTGEPVWIKNLAGCLGEMLIEDIPLIVKATFTIEASQVKITSLENIFSEDINKQSVFRAGLAPLILYHKMKPYLSRQVLRYE